MEIFIVNLRKATVIVLIVSVAILTFIGILSIWDVLSHDASTKAIESMLLLCGVAIMFFAGGAIVRHDAGAPVAGTGKRHWVWIVIGVLALLFVGRTLLSLVFYGL